MAYIRQLDEEDEKTAAPLAPGNAGGSVGGAGVPNVTGTRPQTPQQKQGSGGFHNLKSFLDAGQGRHKSIADKGTSLLGAEKSVFDKAAQPLRDASFTALTPDSGTLEKLVGTASREGNTVTPSVSGVGSGAGGAPTAMDQLGNFISQDYHGPMSVDYNPNATGNLRSVDALSATDTAGTEMAKGTPYSSGANRLDQSLFGADAESQGAIAGNKSGGTAFLDSAETEANALAGKAHGFKVEAEKARDTARGGMEALDASIRGGVSKRLAEVQAREAKRAGQVQENSSWNEKDREHTAYKGTYKPGEAASEGNVVTADEAGWMGTLGKLLGKEGIAKTGTHAPGAVDWQVDPEKSWGDKTSQVKGQSYTSHEFGRGGLTPTDEQKRLKTEMDAKIALSTIATPWLIPTIVSEYNSRIKAAGMVNVDQDGRDEEGNLIDMETGNIKKEVVAGYNPNKKK